MSMFDPRSIPPSNLQILACFLNITIYAVTTNVLWFIGPALQLGFAGRLNDSTMLAVAGLSSTCYNIMVLSILVGINSAQETLTS